MAVNGIEIEVGQRWRTRGCGEALVKEITDDFTHGFPVHMEDSRGERFTVCNDGFYDSLNGNPLVSLLDLVELISQPSAGDTQQAATFNPGLAINPKDAIGSTKLPLHLWPNEATALGCVGMLEGMLKYGRNNFIAGSGVIASIYVDALFRHVLAWFEGEEITHDTKTDHLGNALACLGIIVKARAHGRLIDDRNFATAQDGQQWRDFIESLTPHVSRLQEMFKDKSPRHFTIADVQRAPADDTEGGEA